MSEQLRGLINEFYEEQQRETTERIIQAKELQSIQGAIRYVAKEEILSDEERKEVNDIININNEWWCKISRGRLF